MPTFENIHGLEKEILEEEERLRAARKKLLDARRKLPPQKVLDYNFVCGETGRPVRLYECFQNKADLIVIHNMGTSCPGCTLWADEFNGSIDHIEDRAALVLISNDDWEKQSKFAQQRGWRFKRASSLGTSFFKDMGFEGDDEGFGIYRPGVSTFVKKEGGKVYRVQRSFFGPGDEYCGTWNLIELLEKGAEGWFAKIKYTKKNGG